MPRADIRAAPIATLAVAAAVAVRERRRRVAAERELHAERARRAALQTRMRELERAWQVRTSWLAGLSHELRTPLAAMISFSELAADDPLPEARHEHAGCVSACGDHLLGLLEELRDLSALDAGALRLVPSAVDPADVGRECVALLDPEALARGVRLRFQPATCATLLLDPTRLRQILINYLANAIRFTEPGGTVTLALRRVEGRLQVAVSDTGRGIASSDQPRVFDERFRAADDGGSGLGLAIVKRLVEAQGGEVAVTSRPSLGSTFYAWLPWIPAAAAEVEPVRPTPLAHAVR